MGPRTRDPRQRTGRRGSLVRRRLLSVQRENGPESAERDSTPEKATEKPAELAVEESAECVHEGCSLTVVLLGSRPSQQERSHLRSRHAGGPEPTTRSSAWRPESVRPERAGFERVHAPPGAARIGREQIPPLFVAIATQLRELLVGDGIGVAQQGQQVLEAQHSNHWRPSGGSSTTACSPWLRARNVLWSPLSTWVEGCQLIHSSRGITHVRHSWLGTEKAEPAGTADHLGNSAVSSRRPCSKSSVRSVPVR
ncbi:hypothetical protein SAMN04489731_102581 [Amycolatopsis regifaucium]|nr:hypothetical protein SAMN04489731_102581 [Amycolatopsis regifaucium]